MNSGSVFAGKDAPHRHDIGEADEARNRYEIADEVEVQLLEQRCIYCVHGAAEDERVAVGGGSNGRLGGELAAGARPILHDNRLAKATDNHTGRSRGRAHEDPVELKETRPSTLGR